MKGKSKKNKNSDDEDEEEEENNISDISGNFIDKIFAYTERTNINESEFLVIPRGNQEFSANFQG